MEQRPAIENRRQQSGAEVPETRSRPKYLSDRERVAAGVGAERDVGQPVGGRDPDLGACGMQIGLGLKHVRPLRDGGRGQAEGQVGRK
jgi:ribosomal protein S8E